LRAPERVLSFLALNISHPWVTPRMLAPQLWRFLLYQPEIALFGYPLMRYTDMVGRAIGGSFVDRSQITRAEIAWYTERFRDPVCARAGTDTYRTFWRYELPAGAKYPETRRSIVPTLALFGASDQAIHHSLAAADSAQADDYRLELVYHCGHFIAEERPALVRSRLLDMAANFT
jgi:pimeloyl-ACP methyl ester carboxylesterase